MAAIRFVLTLPFRILVAVVVLPVKASLALLGFSIRTTWVTSRAVLRSSLISFACGVGLGWFISTPTGRQLTASLRELMTGEATGPLDDSSVAARVRDELASGTRTWHLPQPEVAVFEGTATLKGSVPHETGRSDLIATAGGVRGVTSVIDELGVGEDEAVHS